MYVCICICKCRKLILFRVFIYKFYAKNSIQVFKWNSKYNFLPFCYFSDIQEFYELTLLDDSKTIQQKTAETLQIASKWEQDGHAIKIADVSKKRKNIYIYINTYYVCVYEYICYDT